MEAGGEMRGRDGIFLSGMQSLRAEPYLIWAGYANVICLSEFG